jgi:uncharacterized glyoxalase superfamily metalloenzyme YdcJ
MIEAPLSEAASPRMAAPYATSDEVRARFASAMSALYRSEVPQYGTLVDLVADVNAAALRHDPSSLPGGCTEMARLDVERHGAIRLGTAHELNTIRRIFAVMGMSPVGYYDLSVAGVPVHSTAFRPVKQGALSANPFRIFTSLLRLELIRDPELRDIAARILRHRNIFSARALQLTEKFEAEGGLSHHDADAFVHEVLHTFRWHGAATVSRADYQRLHDAHRLIADVVCFKGPHINHLTPRTLDIDAAQAEMPRRGIVAKEVVEGPPRRRVPILLRQTSFKALEETVTFAGDRRAQGAHTARFGEIEQRGIALTRAGRALYDSLLERARGAGGAGDEAAGYEARLAKVFEAFPDDLATLRRDGLGFFRYAVRAGAGLQAAAGKDLEALIEQGIVEAMPITYEDFLPVSAAGIFQSNLDGNGQEACSAPAAQAQFEEALGAQVIDEISLYEAEQAESIERVTQQLGGGAAA